ncbi:hypothetical protein PR202_ga07051 [Eleusine coracana subsp. coracana]|uniref:RING-type E3 ubiquitin transferase n=1 Tax=Eleusine coracana subsp. coracana TaxID=191504 RepID=A0AAV5BYX6_ELECO|nr:hypothetical protein QOZ80_2AG0107800 [Eleusine coracana subsp. coracana]GJM90743.1 hypothetical protein PR202_ga07051 [Eleusine coracana subsp. coracana]
MLNQLRHRPPRPAAAANDGYLACYGLVVGCASLLLLTILAATVSIAKACILAGAVGVSFGLVGCLSRWCANDGAAAGVPAPPTGRPCRTADAVAVDVLPAFAYAAADGEGSSKAGRRALCSVCLEDVQAGEMVRRMPACGHVFHVACIDMWLHSHRTCPLCRRDVWAQARPGNDAKPSPAADPPDNNALPPV